MKKSQKTYHHWEEQNMVRAVEAVKQGESIRKAAVSYSIPRSTLSDRITGKVQEGAKMGRPTVIPDEIEKEMAKKAIKYADMGHGYSRVDLMRKAGEVCKRLRLNNNFKNGIAGRNWLKGFKNRNKDIAIRKTELLNTSRSRMMNPTKVGAYFTDLERLMTATGLKDAPVGRVWNMDEKKLSFQHKPAYVIARKGSRGVPGRVGSSREAVTVVACVSDSGASMPPTVIVKGLTERCLSSWETGNAPPGTYWMYQKNSYMSDEISEDWFSNVFLKHCGEERPQILVLDSVKCHEKDSMLEMAVQSNIHIMAIPPHTSHKLQVLDVSVFSPLQTRYDIILSDFEKNPSQVVTKANWSKLFCQAWAESVTPNNVRSGFRACGIRPLDRNAIPKEAYLPSEPSSQPVIEHKPVLKELTVDASDNHANNNCSTGVSVDGSEVVSNPGSPNNEGKENVLICTTYTEALHSIQESMPAELLLDFITRFETQNTTDDPLYNVWADVYVKSKSELASQNISEIKLGQAQTTANLSDNTFTLPSSQGSYTCLSSVQTLQCQNNLLPSVQCTLDDILPSPRSTMVKPVSSRAITSHRILTSEKIMQKKRETAEKKRKLEEEKTERRRKQEERKKEREEQQRIKQEKKIKKEENKKKQSLTLLKIPEINDILY